MLGQLLRDITGLGNYYCWDNYYLLGPLSLLGPLLWLGNSLVKSRLSVGAHPHLFDRHQLIEHRVHVRLHRAKPALFLKRNMLQGHMEALKGHHYLVYYLGYYGIAHSCYERA